MHEKVQEDSLACREILKASRMDKWLIGRTKVFLKYYHVERLAKMLEDYRRKVVTAQRRKLLLDCVLIYSLLSMSF